MWFARIDFASSVSGKKLMMILCKKKHSFWGIFFNRIGVGERNVFLHDFLVAPEPKELHTLYNSTVT